MARSRASSKRKDNGIIYRVFRGGPQLHEVPSLDQFLASALANKWLILVNAAVLPRGPNVWCPFLQPTLLSQGELAKEIKGTSCLKSLVVADLADPALQKKIQEISDAESAFVHMQTLLHDAPSHKTSPKKITNKNGLAPIAASTCVSSSFSATRLTSGVSSNCNPGNVLKATEEEAMGMSLEEESTDKAAMEMQLKQGQIEETMDAKSDMQALLHDVRQVARADKTQVETAMLVDQGDVLKATEQAAIELSSLEMMAQLLELKKNFDDFKEDVEDMEEGFNDLKKDITTLKEDMEEGFNDLKKDIKKDITTLKEDMEEGFNDLKKDITTLKELTWVRMI